MKGPIIVRVQTNYHEAQWLLETGTPVEIDTRYAQTFKGTSDIYISRRKAANTATDQPKTLERNEL